MDKRKIYFTDNARFKVVKTDGKPATLAGYAAVWNAISTDRGGYAVRLKPGSATLAQPSHALFHHDYRLLIGNTENNSLRLTSDDVGVYCEIDLPNTGTGRDVLELVDKKYVKGMSFAMVSSPRGVVTSENGQEILDVEAFAMDEVTITPIPSFIETTIAVKPVESQAASYANRAAQAIKLEQLKLDLYRLPQGRVSSR